MAFDAEIIRAPGTSVVGEYSHVDFRSCPSKPLLDVTAFDLHHCGALFIQTADRLKKMPRKRGIRIARARACSTGTQTS
ncbi:MAG TPA: hypothetical protein VJS42_02240 [Steroidobacteraceae bacterium]|nr:hypothetical protein [Steroidobacteraceae bacterium]